jgi:predicted RecB family nuclease
MSVRTASWVSKTDLTSYLRCPYAFYLLDRGLLRFDETITQHQIRMINEGIGFQASVEARAAAPQVEPRDLPKVFAAESIRLFEIPVFENPTLEIYGKPDAIDTAEGAMIPVEIKSHRDIQCSDELELAFYWLLLDPHRTRAVSPRGYLLLRRNGLEAQVEVEIRPNRLEQVRGLLQEIRDARRVGVQPRVCACPVCSGVMRDEIDRATREKKDLTRIWGVGRVFAEHLEQIGISDYERLLATDSLTVVEKLHDRRCNVSATQVDRWKHHATSYCTSRPVVFGDPLTLDGRFLALDLEYEGGLIWLVGICLVGPADREYLALWADTAEQANSNLMRLVEIVTSNPLLPVVTWNGNGADIPQLRNAMQRLGLGQALDTVESRHLDLFHYAKNGMRFPIPQLALAQVARYFAIPKVSRIRDGLEALFLHQEYRNSPGEDRRVALKTNLLEYNRDDLDALVGVAERLAGLQSGSREVSTDRPGSDKALRLSQKGCLSSGNKRPRQTARLTWRTDVEIGDFGGYRCREADYQIERKDRAGRHFYL